MKILSHPSGLPLESLKLILEFNLEAFWHFRRYPDSPSCMKSLRTGLTEQCWRKAPFTLLHASYQECNFLASIHIFNSSAESPRKFTLTLRSHSSYSYVRFNQMAQMGAQVLSTKFNFVQVRLSRSYRILICPLSFLSRNFIFTYFLMYKTRIGYESNDTLLRLFFQP